MAVKDSVTVDEPLTLDVFVIASRDGRDLPGWLANKEHLCWISVCEPVRPHPFSLAYGIAQSELQDGWQGRIHKDCALKVHTDFVNHLVVLAAQGLLTSGGLMLINISIHICLDPIALVDRIRKTFKIT